MKKERKKRVVNELTRCQFVDTDEKRCNGFRIKNSNYCYVHSPKENRCKSRIITRIKDFNLKIKDRKENV